MKAVCLPTQRVNDSCSTMSLRCIVTNLQIRNQKPWNGWPQLLLMKLQPHVGHPNSSLVTLSQRPSILSEKRVVQASTVELIWTSRGDLRNKSRRSCQECIINSWNWLRLTLPKNRWKSVQRLTMSWAVSRLIRRHKNRLYPVCMLLEKLLQDCTVRTDSVGTRCLI